MNNYVKQLAKRMQTKHGRIRGTAHCAVLGRAGFARVYPAVVATACCRLVPNRRWQRHLVKETR